MLFLTKKDIESCYSMSQAVQACKEALGLYSEGKASVPLRTNISVDKQKGQSLYMPAYVNDSADALGVKIVSVYPDNINKGLPSVPATMVVLDAETGIVSAIMDGTYLTQLRTGAVQGAATDLLAKEDARVGALIGTGGQAEGQLSAMLAVRSLEEVRIFDIDWERAKAFATEMEAKYKVSMVPTKDAKDCVLGADIITSVTTSKLPTFQAEWVKKGAHVNGVGAYTPEMCELPKEIIKQANCVIFDTVDGVLQEAGDMIQPLKEGYLTDADFNGELGHLYSGNIVGRTSSEEITVFKTVGSAVLDVYVANQIVETAKDKQIGQEIQM